MHLHTLHRRLSSMSSRLRTAVAAGLALLSGGLAAEPAHAATVYQVSTGDNDTTTTLILRGEIIAGDLGRLQAQTAKVPPGRRIALMLDSPGGLLTEGIAIGRYVYSAKITTVAIQGPGCHSSCTFIFLAGRNIENETPLRIMMKGARVGFHQAALPGLPTNQSYSAADVTTATTIGQEWVKMVNTYFNDIKADPEFLTMYLSAQHKSITLLNEFDALRLGIYVMDPTTKRLTTPAEFKR